MLMHDIISDFVLISIIAHFDVEELFLIIHFRLFSSSGAPSKLSDFASTEKVSESQLSNDARSLDSVPMLMRKLRGRGRSRFEVIT